jgi:hypothetical protein
VFSALAIGTLQGCGTAHLHDKKETFISNDTKVSNTVKRFEFKTAQINDQFKYSLAPIITGSPDRNCDSLCNAQIREMLSKINIQKQSGNNSYQWAYDKLNNQIVITTQMGETINKYKDSVSDLKQIQDQKSIEIKEVPVPRQLSKWESFFIRTGQICWLIIIVYIAFRIGKMYLPKINFLSSINKS